MLTMEFSSFWDIFAIPFGYVMQFFNMICGDHYALSLLLFALVMKLLMLPLAIKQQKTQIRTAKLRPRLALIEQKYAGRTDRATMQKKQQEIMDLQQQEGISPLAGCLPLLIQFPIIIALYRIIRMPLKYVCNLEDQTLVDLYNTIYEPEELVEKFSSIPADAHIELVSKIKELGASLYEQFPVLEEIKLPNFTLFGSIDLSLKPSFKVAELNGNAVNLWLLAIPVLCCALTYLSTWLSRKFNQTPTTGAETPEQQSSMKIMNLMMPLMTLWIAFITSGAVGLYWFYTSLLGILQIWLLAKFMPLPTYTEEEIRQMQREVKKGTQKRDLHGLRVDENGRPKSLHYEDDEDEY